MLNPIYAIRESRRQRGRLRAGTLLLAGMTLATLFARTGTTVTHTGPTDNVTCGVMGCTGYISTSGQSVKGGGHTGGGGTIHIGS